MTDDATADKIAADRAFEALYTNSALWDRLILRRQWLRDNSYD